MEFYIENMIRLLNKRAKLSSARLLSYQPVISDLATNSIAATSKVEHDRYNMMVD